MNVGTGKPGTLSENDFEAFTDLCGRYGVSVVASKVGKICAKASAPFLHENPGSLVGKAYAALGTSILGATGNIAKTIDKDSYGFINEAVHTYGAEVVVRKLAKIATRQAKSNPVQSATLTQLSTKLKTLFPSA